MYLSSNDIIITFRKIGLVVSVVKRKYYPAPFFKLYENSVGETVSSDFIEALKRKHPSIDTLSHDRIQCSLQILKKFNISEYEACKDPHVFCMNPITMDNYGEILKECGFLKILPKYIIRYHTLVRSRTIQQLKANGLIDNHLCLKEKLEKSIKDWKPDQVHVKFDESNCSILQIRMNVLEAYLKWKLHIRSDEFQKYCRNYLPLKHKPMADIQEAIELAHSEIGLDFATVRRNGFLISADPIKTKMIIDNVPSLAGINIREVIRIEPAVLKNNYTSLLEIKNMLEEFRISYEAQRHCLKVYCMQPKTVRERLEELKNLKEYQILSSHPRILSMVIHKRKVMSRLNKIQAANKQCYSLNHLISSSKQFNNYINNFGDKICGRDVATLICNSLMKTDQTFSNIDNTEDQRNAAVEVMKQLRRHKFCLHTSLHVINDNIELLQRWFTNDVIFMNPHLLLYPASEIREYLDFLLSMRNTKGHEQVTIPLDNSYNNLNYGCLTDHQILSLILYEIEKKYHFTGDGIWAKQDYSKTESNITR